MNLRTVLTLAAVLACLRPAVALVASNLPLALVDTSTPQMPSQVFVRDVRGSDQGDDAGGHVAGLRAPRSDDDPTSPVYDAAGTALYFTLEKWRAAGGGADIAADGDGDRVTLTLHRLIAFGHYSVFLRTDGTDGPHFAPLDGSGITNNFDARQDGSATATIGTDEHLASGSWLVVVYHSDAQDHGNSPGDFTRTTHAQLIVKLP